MLDECGEVRPIGINTTLVNRTMHKYWNIEFANPDAQGAIELAPVQINLFGSPSDGIRRAASCPLSAWRGGLPEPLSVAPLRRRQRDTANSFDLSSGAGRRRSKKSYVRSTHASACDAAATLRLVLFFVLVSMLWAVTAGAWAAESVLAPTSLNPRQAENLSPTFPEGVETTRFVGEETVSGGDFGSPISATDEDGDPLAYTLGGTDAGYFDIDTVTGQLRTGESTTLEYETRNFYEVVVSVSDNRGGTADIEVDIHVLDSLVILSQTPPVKKRVQVTANKSEINEGDAVTFKFELYEPAPAGGLEVFYSLKQLTVDDDAHTYDFRPIPNIGTHHRASVIIEEGRTHADIRFQTVSDQYEETDVILIADIGLSAHNNFDGEACNYIGEGNVQTISSRPTGCWARVDVNDRGNSQPPALIPIVRYASVFPGHVREFGGSNIQYILPGERIKLTISLNVPAPPGGIVVYFGLTEKSSNVSEQIPQYPDIDRRSVTIPEGETETFVEVNTRTYDPVAEDCEEQGNSATGCIRAYILAASPIPIGNQYYLPYVHYPWWSRFSANTLISRGITIAADASPITEGETARFTVRLSSAAPAGGLAVEVALSEIGEFAAVSLPETRTVTIGAGDHTAALAVPTVDDEVDEDDGKNRGPAPGANRRVRGGRPRRGRGGGARRRWTVGDHCRRRLAHRRGRDRAVHGAPVLGRTGRRTGSRGGPERDRGVCRRLAARDPAP